MRPTKPRLEYLAGQFVPGFRRNDLWYVNAHRELLTCLKRQIHAVADERGAWRDGYALMAIEAGCAQAVLPQLRATSRNAHADFTETKCLHSVSVADAQAKDMTR